MSIRTSRGKRKKRHKRYRRCSDVDNERLRVCDMQRPKRRPAACMTLLYTWREPLMTLLTRTLRTLLALLSMALLLAGCGSNSQSRAVYGATSSLTVTPNPASLAWRVAPLPAGAETWVHTSVVVSPLDGTLAWACSYTGPWGFAI